MVCYHFAVPRAQSTVLPKIDASFEHLICCQQIFFIIYTTLLYWHPTLQWLHYKKFWLMGNFQVIPLGPPITMIFVFFPTFLTTCVRRQSNHGAQLELELACGPEFSMRVFLVESLLSRLSCYHPVSSNYHRSACWTDSSHVPALTYMSFTMFFQEYPGILCALKMKSRLLIKHQRPFSGRSLFFPTFSLISETCFNAR